MYVRVYIAHVGSVESVKISGLVQLTVTAGSDCLVRFWKFKTGQLLNELKMDAAVAKTELHRDRSAPPCIH